MSSTLPILCIAMMVHRTEYPAPVAPHPQPAAFPSEEMTSRLSIDSEISGISANSEQDQQEDGKLKSWLKGISTNSQNSTNSQSAEVPKELEVLCVDDEMVNQIVITELLTASGFKLTSAMSGQEGLKILAERHKQGGVAAFPHLILMDLMMPGMTGLEATKTIRATYPDTSMPIIMLSANDDEASVCTALEIGCNDYIHKPFKAAELLARVGLQTTKTMQIAEAPPAQEAEGCNDDLMLELLPLSVLDRLKAGSSHIADKLDQVTVVMCDIVGFENLVSSMPAKPVVRMVDDFFKKLDGLTDKYNLYKLEPVGESENPPPPLESPLSSSTPHSVLILIWTCMCILGTTSPSPSGLMHESLMVSCRIKALLPSMQAVRGSWCSGGGVQHGEVGMCMEHNRQ